MAKLPKEEKKEDTFLKDLENTPDANDASASSVPSNVDQETGEVTEEEDEFSDTLITLEAAAEYWQFADPTDKQGNIIGKGIPVLDKVFWRGIQKREHDDPKDPKKKAGDIIGFIVQDLDDQFHIVGNSYMISKAMMGGEVSFGDLLRFEYKGQGKTSSGEKINKYIVQKYERKIKAAAITVSPEAATE